MEAKKDKKQKSLIFKLLEDKKAISECIRKKGDIQKLAEERGLKFAKPL
jgi:Tfp pilus assembly ATPase PilU